MWSSCLAFAHRIFFFYGSLNHFGIFGIFVKFIEAFSSFSLTPQYGGRRGGKGEAEVSENTDKQTLV